jgi:hypothetical protein
MNLPENGFHSRKLEHIKREYDHTFSAALKLSDHGTSVRQWNIAVIVAYLGFARVYVEKGQNFPILPLLVAIYLFWVMEAFVKALSYFYGKHTLERVDRLFCEKDESLFNEAIEEYRFRRMGKKPLWGRWGQVHRLSCGLWNCQTFVFYMLPLAFLIVWRCLLGGFLTSIVWLLPAIVFVLSWLLCRWKYPSE